MENFETQEDEIFEEGLGKCTLCNFDQADEWFDQNEYAKAKHLQIIDKNGYHSIINPNGYNYPVAVCIFCLHDKIYNVDKKDSEARFLTLKAIKNETNHTKSVKERSSIRRNILRK